MAFSCFLLETSPLPEPYVAAIVPDGVHELHTAAPQQKVT